MNTANARIVRPPLPAPVLHTVGYLASVLAATVVSSIVLNGLMKDFQFFFITLMIAGMYVSVTAIPGFALTLFLAHGFGRRDWLYFTIAGGLNGVLSLVLLMLAVGDMPNRMLLASSVTGGLFGGLAYWWVAQRRG